MKRVFRPGVFDLFHIGHLRCIQAAADYGTHLIVGVQDDRVIAESRGAPPTIPLHERMELIAAIRCVDEVISYRSSDLSSLLGALEIQILAVGEDYGQHSSYPGQQTTLEYCERSEIEVRRTGRTAGVSTTEIKSSVFSQSLSLKAFWNETTNTMLGSFGGDRNQVAEETARELTLIGPLVEGGDRVLDLGCGDGRLTRGVAPMAREVVAIDYAPRLVERLRHEAIAGVIAIEADVCEVELKVASFDVIILSGLLTNLADDAARDVVRRTAAAVRQGGRILVRSTVADHQRINVVNQFSETLGRLYTAYYRTKQELLEMFADHGLRPEGETFLYRNHADTHVAFYVFEPAPSG